MGVCQALVYKSLFDMSWILTFEFLFCYNIVITFAYLLLSKSKAIL